MVVIFNHREWIRIFVFNCFWVETDEAAVKLLQFTIYSQGVRHTILHHFGKCYICIDQIRGS